MVMQQNCAHAVLSFVMGMGRSFKRTNGTGVEKFLCKLNFFNAFKRVYLHTDEEAKHYSKASDLAYCYSERVKRKLVFRAFLQCCVFSHL